MSSGDAASDLEALGRRLEEEEAAYADLLSALDALADFPLPQERIELHALIERLNALWELPPPPHGLRARLRGGLSALRPFLQRQQEFNSMLVQFLNGQTEESARLHVRLREIVSALVRYLQRVLPLMDARDRVATALATTRSELVLEAFDRRQESLARRLDGLLALRDRLETVSAEVSALRDTLAAGTPDPASAAAAERAARDAAYVAFENRFRGSREEIVERLVGYVPLFQGLAPVLDLGCGRGEFLELLGAQGIEAQGVESNASAVRACRGKGLDVAHAGLLAHLKKLPRGSLGGLFAAQVAEHLPPGVLQSMLREAHRVLRAGGLLLLETVNPRSVLGLLEVYNRDLTHEKPLHPETLAFLTAAAGFSDVRVELRSPVEPSAKLQPVPAETLPRRAVETLNENVARLNALLYAPQEYALLARR